MNAAQPRRPHRRTRAKCHPDKTHHAHGLCADCYNAWWYAANKRKTRRTKRATMPGEIFAEEYALLRSRGHTRRQIAERLKMTPAAVQKAYSRAVTAGRLTPDSDAYRKHVIAVTRVYQHTRWDTAA